MGMDVPARGDGVEAACPFGFCQDIESRLNVPFAFSSPVMAMHAIE
jgi:hypothetical protein